MCWPATILLNSDPGTIALEWRINQNKIKSNDKMVCRSAEELDDMISTENIPGESIARRHPKVPLVKTRFSEDGSFKRTALSK